MGLFDMISKSATDAASKASAKAEEMMEINRLKTEQSHFRDELARTRRKLGNYCYKQYQDGVEFDETMTKLCQEMDRIADEIMRIDDEIEQTRETARARQSQADEERL